jgi:large repetitive protein
MRFIRVFAVIAVLAGITAGAAYALAFDDADYIWPNGEVGTPYYKQLLGRTDVGVPGSDGHCHAKCKFSLIAGQLPPGITLHSDGLVDGTPTALGVYSFWIRLSGVYGGTPAEREFSINVNRVRLRVDTSKAPDAVKGNAYSLKLAAVGGNGASYTWAVDSGTLPAGLNLGADGMISGTPTATGNSVFVVKVTDAEAKTDTHQLAIKVVDPLGIRVPKVAEVGIPFTGTLTGFGGTPNYTFAIAGGLPEGLTFDGTAGITGTPTKRGAFKVAVAIQDADGLNTTINVPLRVVGKLALATRKLTSATVGQAYSLKLKTSGGAHPFRYHVSSGKLPKGLRLAARTGKLTGSAQTAGAYRFRISVTDGLGAVSTRSFSFTVNA